MGVPVLEPLKLITSLRVASYMKGPCCYGKASLSLNISVIILGIDSIIFPVQIEKDYYKIYGDAHERIDKWISENKIDLSMKMT